MHKGHYSDTYYVLARFMGRFARSIATISIVLRIYVKWIIDHLQDHPMGRNPDTLVHILQALHSRSGVAIRHVLRKLQSSSDFQLKGACTTVERVSTLFVSTPYISTTVERVRTPYDYYNYNVSPLSKGPASG
jgi:hypothetical protein